MFWGLPPTRGGGILGESPLSLLEGPAPLGKDFSPQAEGGDGVSPPVWEFKAGEALERGLQPPSQE